MTDKKFSSILIYSDQNEAIYTENESVNLNVDAKFCSGHRRESWGNNMREETLIRTLLFLMCKYFFFVEAGPGLRPRT